MGSSLGKTSEYSELQITPGKGDNLVEGEEECILELAPFQPVFKIHFRDVKINTTKTKSLLLRNPKNGVAAVTLNNCANKQNVDLDVSDLELGPHSEEKLLISWSPKQSVLLCGTVQLEVNGGFEVTILITGTVEGSRKNEMKEPVRQKSVKKRSACKRPQKLQHSLRKARPKSSPEKLNESPPSWTKKISFRTSISCLTTTVNDREFVEIQDGKDLPDCDVKETPLRRKQDNIGRSRKCENRENVPNYKGVNKESTLSGGFLQELDNVIRFTATPCNTKTEHIKENTAASTPPSRHRSSEDGDADVFYSPLSTPCSKRKLESSAATPRSDKKSRREGQSVPNPPKACTLDVTEKERKAKRQREASRKVRVATRLEQSFRLLKSRRAATTIQNDVPETSSPRPGVTSPTLSVSRGKTVNCKVWCSSSLNKVSLCGEGDNISEESASPGPCKDLSALRIKEVSSVARKRELVSPLLKTERKNIQSVSLESSYTDNVMATELVGPRCNLARPECKTIDVCSYPSRSESISKQYCFSDPTLCVQSTNMCTESSSGIFLFSVPFNSGLAKLCSAGGSGDLDREAESSSQSVGRRTRVERSCRKLWDDCSSLETPTSSDLSKSCVGRSDVLSLPNPPQTLNLNFCMDSSQVMVSSENKTNKRNPNSAKRLDEKAIVFNPGLENATCKTLSVVESESTLGTSSSKRELNRAGADNERPVLVLGENGNRDEGYSTMSSDVPAEATAVCSLPAQTKDLKCGAKGIYQSVLNNASSVNVDLEERVNTASSSLQHHENLFRLCAQLGYKNNYPDVQCRLLKRDGDKTPPNKCDLSYPVALKPSTSEDVFVSPQIQDDNDSDIFYCPLEYDRLFPSGIHNPRHSFPPVRQIPALRRFSDSRLYLKPQLSANALLSDALELAMSARDLASAETPRSRLRRSRARTALGNTSSKARESTAFENVNVGGLQDDFSLEEFESADYVRQWLRYDETHGSLRCKALSLGHDEEEMEDWTYELVGSASAYSSRLTITSLPSIQENYCIELEEDSSECLWNSASYLKTNVGEFKPKHWPYPIDSAPLTVHNYLPYTLHNTLLNAVSPKSENHLSCSSSCEQLSSYFSPGIDELFSPDSESKRSSVALSDGTATGRNGTKRISKSNDVDEENGTCSGSVRTDFTRDFYRLVKLESLASSSKSLAWSHDSSVYYHRDGESNPISCSGPSPLSRELGLQSISNFIAEQEKYRKIREEEDAVLKMARVTVSQIKETALKDRDRRAITSEKNLLTETLRVGSRSDVFEASERREITSTQQRSERLHPDKSTFNGAERRSGTDNAKEKDSEPERASSKAVFDELNRMIQQNETDDLVENKQMDNVDVGCHTGWIHFNPKGNHQQTSDVLDMMPSSSSSSSESDIRVHSPSPHSVLGRTDLFVRFGELEQAAMTSFDFLEESSPSVSDSGPLCEQRNCQCCNEKKDNGQVNCVWCESKNSGAC